MSRCWFLLALAAGGCMSVTADVEAIVGVPDQLFPGGGELSGQLISETRTAPVKLTTDLLHDVSTVRIESVRLRPSAGVHTLDFFRGITLTAKNSGTADLRLTSLGPELLMPDADGSLLLPIDVVADTALLHDGLAIEGTIDFIVPEVDWSLGQQFSLEVTGGSTLGP